MIKIVLFTIAFICYAQDTAVYKSQNLKTAIMSLLDHHQYTYILSPDMEDSLTIIGVMKLNDLEKELSLILTPNKIQYKTNHRIYYCF